MSPIGWQLLLPAGGQQRRGDERAGSRIALLFKGLALQTAGHSVVARMMLSATASARVGSMDGEAVMNEMTKWMFAVTAASLTIGCAAVDEDAAACEEARQHVQACFPDQEAKVPDSCDATSAEALLDKDCDTLAAQASDGAADGFCNPFLWWTCTGGGGSSEPEPTGYTVDLEVNICQSELCVEDLFGENKHGAECGKVTLEDADGDVVATDYINEYLTWGGVHGTGDGFDNLDLPPGDYTARLWRRDGSQALDVDGEPAEMVVSLLEGGGVETSSYGAFKILQTEADAVRACSDVVGTLASTCGGEGMSKEDTEWGWVVRIDGVNSEGTYENLKRSLFYYESQAHNYSFPRVRAGSYTLTYIELDVWSSWARDEYRNSKYEDYLELVDRYATGREFTTEVEITPEEIAAGERVALPHVDLESAVCL